MKIKTILDGYRHIRVPVFIFNTLLGDDPFSMNLMVDTGATTTTILQGDALRLGIDFSKLNKAKKPVMGVGGKKNVFELEDVILGFEVHSSSKLVYARLPKIDVVKPTPKTILYPLSVMGIDLLQRLHLDYCNPRVSLTCKTKTIKGISFIQ